MFKRSVGLSMIILTFVIFMTPVSSANAHVSPGSLDDPAKIGYLVVLSSSASTNPILTETNTSSQTLLQNSSFVQVSIDAGAGTNVNLPGYTPANIAVVIGINNTVKWVNNDNMPHTVTAVDGSFDSGKLNAGESFVHTFNETGTYAYLCVYHHWMHGSVTVLQGANMQSQQNLGYSTEYEAYGLVAVGIVVLIVILVVFSKTTTERTRIAGQFSSLCDSRS